MPPFDRTRLTNKALFRGINTRLLADAMPPGKFPIAINVRADGDSKIRTRPGYTQAFTTTPTPVTDIKTYSAIETDNLPRILTHNTTGQVFLDNGTLKGTVGTGGLGASLIPYRPSQSPQSWMYVGNATGYDKFSAPDAGNNVIQQKTGIAEPQAPPAACPDGFQYNEFTGVDSDWTPAGTAGSTGAATTTDTATAIFKDPASISPATKIRYTVQVGTSQYRVGETLVFAKSGGGTIAAEVEDVYPPINGGSALTVQSIYYFSGTTGRCIVVPSQFQVGSNTQAAAGTINPVGGLPFLPGQIAGLRRGALIEVGSEVCFVLSVTTGPQGQLAIEVSTTGTHTSTETVVGIPGICCSGLTNLVVGQTITNAVITSTISTGMGTLSKTLSPNPFNLSLGSIGTPQEDDYIHLSLAANIPVNVTQLQLVFDIGDGSFTENALYFAVQPSTIVAALDNTQPQLDAAQQQATNDSISDTTDSRNQPLDVTATQPAAPGTAATGENQSSEIMFPITALTRIGNDQTKTLANCVGVQIQITCTGGVNVEFGSLWVGGGGQPDVGATGAPYLYRVRPRSSLTGARGNPSPETRYGVLNRRQPTIVSLPSAAYDSQIDTWDIERYGGSVVGLDTNGNAIWHLVGSTSASATTFVDNVFDDSALAGEILDFTNFEPWPTVDVPWIATVGSGGISSVTVTGTAIIVLGTTFPATIARWLPGTLITLNGQLTYTVWNRPVAVSGGWLIRIIENAGAPTVTTLTVNEPNVANQPLPYLWGPDANGIIFGVGDPFRPGALYSSTQNNPDSTPNNIYDLTPPSEPLMGGIVVDGLPMVASSKRWWNLQSALSTPQRWYPVETPAGRGLAAPMGVTTDGKLAYFVAKDGIYSMIPGLPANSLTDVDLANIFPRDGNPGANLIYAGFTVYAPNYAYAAQFRLSIINSILRFHYYDSSGLLRILVLDMSLDGNGNPRMAWSVDQPAANFTVSYQPEQPPSTLLSTTAAYPQGYFADVNGVVYTEEDLANDNGTPIAATLSLPEWNGGDARLTRQWLDSWLDCLPAASSGILLSPVSDGNAIGTPETIAQSVVRVFSINPLGNPIAQFLGLILQWTDDFGSQSAPTQVYEWSEEFVVQPLLIRSWQSVPTSHGMQSYHHIRKVVFAYLTAGTRPVTLAISAYDGTSPSALTLPGTNGTYQKAEFVPTFNKGLLFTYVGSCPDDWAPDLPACEVWVGQWNRSSPYAVFQDLGGIEAQ